MARLVTRTSIVASDLIPNQFTFTDQTGVALSSTITSTAVTIGGLSQAVTFTASGGTIDKNSDGNFQTTQSLANGDTMRARVTSSGSNSTAVNCTVSAGGVSDIFTATTVSSGTVGINMAWADLPDSTTTFREADFSSSSTADTPFSNGPISNNIWNSTGGLSNGPYWECRLKDPTPTVPDPEATNSFKCWGESVAADACQLYVVTAVVEFSSALLTAMNANNGGGKVFYHTIYNSAGNAAESGIERVVILNNGDSDQSNSTGGSYFNLVNAGAGGNYQRDGTNTPLNLASRPGEKLWIAFVHDFRPSSGNDRGGHIFYKYEGDGAVSKALFRGYNVNYVFAGAYADDETGRGFTGGGTSGHGANFWAYWDNINWTESSTRTFKMYHHKSANGKFALPF